MRRRQAIGLTLAVVAAATTGVVSGQPVSQVFAAARDRTAQLPSTTTYPATVPDGAPSGTRDRAGVREVFSPDGSITQVRVTTTRSRPRRAPSSFQLSSTQVVTIQKAGDSDAKFDLVFVGDGYTADEMDLYHSQVSERWQEMLGTEPYASLQDEFNVWQVNVVSPESGVDNDPSQGVSRDTALDGEFWCADDERSLCVDDTVAQQYAELAPAVDQVVALANSDKYGGSGGSIAVSSGGDSESGQIMLHELGHSIGGLADEYDGYDDNSATGSEPNLSTSDEDTMRSGQTDWYDDLGQQTPDGGVIGAYAGTTSGGSVFYRPSEDSLMRSLGQPFNLVGLRAMREGILSKVQSPS